MTILAFEIDHLIKDEEDDDEEEEESLILV